MLSWCSTTLNKNPRSTTIQMSACAFQMIFLCNLRKNRTLFVCHLSWLMHRDASLPLGSSRVPCQRTECNLLLRREMITRSSKPNKNLQLISQLKLLKNPTNYSVHWSVWFIYFLIILKNKSVTLYGSFHSVFYQSTWWQDKYILICFYWFPELFIVGWNDHHTTILSSYKQIRKTTIKIRSSFKVF